ncbi:SagB/ThcOx family dehydrogenase [Amycolatopsis magusensis]|uniref:SagB/ThcOx family dehydrogenase n=1 Tax=Amycolatopsis magusensis TaxID=882444 RepID=UPI0024A7FBD8|nr:SagB/ThcOx family dehydrogenase [Amycolatopsis magusensis]MDI5978198.1 SagB/ThcOx family dehydrogenase [Amycolatopsis magusensis]
MRLRRASCVVCYWYEGEFVAHPYPGPEPTAVHPAAAEILSAFGEWVEPAKAAELLDHLTPATVAEAVEALFEAGLLLAEDSPQATRDAEVAQQWATWSPEASFFHYATQDLRYPTEEERQRLLAEGCGQDFPDHVLFTGYPDAPRMLLPRRPAELRLPYDQVLYARRTHRDFAAEPVALDTLATLLATVFGPVDFIDSGHEVLFRRTSPSGGARQELEPYVAIRNVDGVDPGVYHYNLREHSLELLSPGLTDKEAAHLCADQDWAGGAAFLVVLAAVIDRMSSKYRNARCYRVSLLNAGHLGQTFALTATALGLGPAQTGAFHDTAVAERCGLDNVGHTPVYVLAAGHPRPEPENGPPPARLDTFSGSVLHRAAR